MPVSAQLEMIDSLVLDLVAVRGQLEALSAVIDNAHASSAEVHLDCSGLSGKANLRVDPKRMAMLFHACSVARAFHEYTHELHTKYVQQQSLALPLVFQLSASRGEIHLQLGANPEHAVPGWMSLGLDPGCGSELSPAIRASMTTSSVAVPLPTASCAYIYASHFLEHLAFPNLVDAALLEVRRILRPGGILRVVVPDAEVWLEALVAGAYGRCKDRVRVPFSGPLWDAVRQTWPWWDLQPPDPFARSELGVVASYLGCCGGVEAALTSGHQMPFDFALMSATLRYAGFVAIERSFLHCSCHPDLANIDRSSSVASASYVRTDGVRQSLSLFVEARAP